MTKTQREERRLAAIVRKTAEREYDREYWRRFDRSEDDYYDSYDDRDPNGYDDY